MGNAGFGQKVFPIAYLNAALSYSGIYSINGSPIDLWINEFISGSFHLHNTIEEFVISLSDSLTREMRPFEFEEGTIIHVAGYHKSNNQSYLEHWHISNTGLMADGYYEVPLTNFHYSNDFNSRINQEQREIIIRLEENPSFHQFYINGFPPGRISAMHLKSVMDYALGQIWGNTGWMFRKPTNLFESSNIVKLYYTFVSELFKMSDHNALYIGGDTQIYLISRPQDLDLSGLV